MTPMAKDGQMLEVHSTCVQAHQAAGWRVAAQPDPAAIEHTLAAAAEAEAQTRARNGLRKAAAADRQTPEATAPEQQKKGGKAASKE